jgi:hypothetical protein
MDRGRAILEHYEIPFKLSWLIGLCDRFIRVVRYDDTRELFDQVLAADVRESMPAYYNRLPYPDPVGNEAVGNVLREMRKLRRRNRHSSQRAADYRGG